MAGTDRGELARARLTLEDGIAIGAACLVSALSVHAGWFDTLCMMLRMNEQYELDEYVGSSFVLLATTVIMFVRREWQLRRRLEALGAQEQCAYEAARRDPLTGLANRLALSEMMDDSKGQDVLFLLIDLDGFKIINDLQGHAAGDAVLKEVAKRLQALSNEMRGSFVARIGGDEFGWLMLSSSEQDAASIQERIVRSLGEPVRLQAIDVTIGASIGSVASTERKLTPDELLNLADIAMYRNKAYRSLERRGSAAMAASARLY